MLNDNTLSSSIYFSKKDLFKKHLLSGGNVNEPDEIGIMPIRYAAGHKDSEYLTLLIDAGGDIHYLTDTGETLLFEACKEPKNMQILIDHGVDVNAKNSIKRSVLHKAVEFSAKESVVFLIDKGIDPYSKVGCRYSPYSMANPEMKEFIDAYVMAKKEQSVIDGLIDHSDEENDFIF